MSLENGSKARAPGVSSPQDNSRSERLNCGIAIMAKASVPGRAKTRLVPPLSFDEAAAFNTAFLQDIADNLLLAGKQIGIAPYVAFGPPGSEHFFRQILPESVKLMDVWLPNFGQCLLFTIEEMLRRRHSAAVVLNSDSPTLPTALLVETAELLAQPGDRAVLGPSSDGGYYLLGLKRAHRKLFEGIAWSTERVAEQTLARAKEIGLDVHILPTWYDIDDVAALRTLRADLSEQKLTQFSMRPFGAPVTAALMNRLGRETDLLRRIRHSAQIEELPA